MSTDVKIISFMPMQSLVTSITKLIDSSILYENVYQLFKIIIRFKQAVLSINFYYKYWKRILVILKHRK
jgi:hypothetical protein